MYTLIGSPQSRTRRVAWMLEELGLDYEWVTTVRPASPEARRHNPSGKIPALEVDGRVLLDSVAIIQYLADRHGRFTYPAGTLERAEQDSFTQFCVDEVDGPLWTAAKSRFVLPEAYRVPEIKGTMIYEFGRSMKVLETRLGERTWIMGDEFTVPDILFGHCAGWAANAGFEVPAGTVREYFNRVRQRPALARAEGRGEALNR
ncbi:MAG: glutathione S-transferase family protein [Paracoccaceae bacterium]